MTADEAHQNWVILKESLVTLDRVPKEQKHIARRVLQQRHDKELLIRKVNATF
jgi:hypothetical protein